MCTTNEGYHFYSKYAIWGSVWSTLNKVVPYSITSVGHAADPGFLAVSPQVTLVINPVVGCRYFPPGLRLLSQPKRSPHPLAAIKKITSTPISIFTLRLCRQAASQWVRRNIPSTISSLDRPCVDYHYVQNWWPAKRMSTVR